MEKSPLIRIVETTLPALSGSLISYNGSSNMLQTQSYTSLAGNTYWQGIRLSDRIIVNYDLGQGWLYTFLNGIRVYGYNGTAKHLIGSRFYNCRVYSEKTAIDETVAIVADYMRGQMKIMNTYCPDYQILDFSRQLVKATQSTTKLLA